jgi:hypothetical protein
MDYYIKSTVFWSTLAVYLTLMVAAIILQAGSTEEDSPRAAALIVIGSILALALLIPHFLVTAAYLKPEFIVSKLMRRITTGYLASVERRGAEAVAGTSADRLLPVVEIAERSVEKGDIATVGSAIARMVARFEHARDVEKIASPELARYFIMSLGRIGQKAISEADEQQAAVEVVQGVTTIGHEGALPQAVALLDRLAFASLRQDQETAVGEAVDAMAQAYREADEEVRGLVVESFGALVPRLAQSGQQLLLEKILAHAAEIATAEPAGSHGRSRAIDVLESAGRESAVSRLVRVVRRAGVTMSTLGRQWAATDRSSAQAVVLSLLRVERSLDRSERDTIAALDFSRMEVEQLLDTADGTVAATEKPASGTEAGFSDLWGEPKQ